MPLDAIRERINRLDRQIVALLDERARAGQEAGEEKRRLGQPLRNPAREAEVIRRIGDLSDGSMPRRGLENIYRAIISETLASEYTEEDACPGIARMEGKRDAEAEVLENSETSPGFFRMRLRVPEIACSFAPGQFFQLLLPGSGTSPFLRRPFAPAETAVDSVTFYYQVVGKGTEAMSGIRSGTFLKMLAPLGNTYSLLPPGSRALVVGGGCGAPSLLPLARRFRDEGVYVIGLMGARTARALVGNEAFSIAADRLIIATDDGSQGCRGTPLDAYRLDQRLRDEPVDRIYACGPLPMLRAVAELAREIGIDCEVSLEERMACGFGACMGCVVPAYRDRETPGSGTVYRRVCHEGPVFNSRDLAWEEIR